MNVMPPVDMMTIFFLFHCRMSSSTVMCFFFVVILFVLQYFCVSCKFLLIFLNFYVSTGEND